MSNEQRPMPNGPRWPVDPEVLRVKRPELPALDRKAGENLDEDLALATNLARHGHLSGCPEVMLMRLHGLARALARTTLAALDGLDELAAKLPPDQRRRIVWDSVEADCVEFGQEFAWIAAEVARVARYLPPTEGG